MLAHANSAGTILHIYFSIIYPTINWLKARETRTVEKRSDVKSSKAKWPDAVRMSVSDRWMKRRNILEERTERGGRAKGRFTLPCRWYRERSKLLLQSHPSSEMAGTASHCSPHLLSDRWQKEHHCCQLTVLWTAGNTKYPAPCFPGSILLLTFRWCASCINAASAANQSQCSPSSTAPHTSSQLNNIIHCLSALRVRHLEDETFFPSPIQ